MIKHQGGCHCGQVKFRTDYDPLLVTQCHCQRCRRLSGTMTFYTIFGDDEVLFEGKMGQYDFLGGSGMPMRLFFCQQCSTKLYYAADVFEGFKLIVTGSFDNSSDFEPQAEVFTNNKMNWLRDNGCIQYRFPEAGLYDRLQIMIDNLEKRSA